MDRRQFVRATSVVAATTVAIVVSPVTFAAAARTDLLSAPDQFVGREFLLDDGTRVTLQRVDSLSRDPTWRQWELHFRGSSELTEGTYWFSTDSGAAVMLYVQANGSTARASISRLA